LTATSPVDLLIAGGGPAGCAAAIVAGRSGRSVLLIEPRESPRSTACPGWLSPQGVRQCGELGIDPSAAGAVEYPGLRLWPWDLAKPLQTDEPNLTGWCIQPDLLGAALLATARRRGATGRR
jgi:flavin-dependent dehydrogenase